MLLSPESCRIAAAGEGTTFTVRLPRQVMLVAEAPEEPVDAGARASEN